MPIYLQNFFLFRTGLLLLQYCLSKVSALFKSIPHPIINTNVQTDPVFSELTLKLREIIYSALRRQTKHIGS